MMIFNIVYEGIECVVRSDITLLNIILESNLFKTCEEAETRVKGLVKNKKENQ